MIWYGGLGIFFGSRSQLFLVHVLRIALVIGLDWLALDAWAGVL